MSEEKKKPLLPDGTGDNVNEKVERLERELEKLRADNEGYRRNLTTDERARELVHEKPEETFARQYREGVFPPTKHIVYQLAGSHTLAIHLCSIGTRSREYRLIKRDWPNWIDPTLGPSLRYQPDARRVVIVETMKSMGIPDHMCEQVLAMDRQEYRQELSNDPYAHTATAHHEVLGKGKRGDHALVHRLRLPADRLNGLVEAEARVYCNRFEDIPEGAPLPAWWDEALKPTGADVIVYEALAPHSKTFSRSEDEAPRRPLPGVRDGGGMPSPGRY